MDCGEKSVKVEITQKARIGRVSCGRCELTKEVLVDTRSEPVVSFGDFIDVHSFEEIFQRIENYIEDLKKRNERRELILCYNILINICYAKITEILGDKEATSFNGYIKWKNRATEIDRQLKPLEAEKLRELSEFRIGRRSDLERYKSETGVASRIEGVCRNCGKKLALNERYCSVCGKKS